MFEGSETGEINALAVTETGDFYEFDEQDKCLKL